MKIGDRVTVYRKVKKYGIWVPNMDNTVGLSGVIVGEHTKYVDVKLDSSAAGNYDQWWYPRSSLKYGASK